jgi:hypothetical protein
MENINMTHVFKHPKYYTELRKRNKSDQAISDEASTEATSVRPGPGQKHQASSSKQQASSKPEPVQVQASSAKRQASQPE